MNIWIFLTAFNLASFANANCVWYDQCGDDPDFAADGSHVLNCHYKGSPIESKDPQMIQWLQSACPHLLLEHGNAGLESTEVSLCCAKNQVEAFMENTLPAKLLGRCPTCLYNFNRIFCDMMCHPGNEYKKV